MQVNFHHALKQWGWRTLGGIVVVSVIGASACLIELRSYFYFLDELRAVCQFTRMHEKMIGKKERLELMYAQRSDLKNLLRPQEKLPCSMIESIAALLPPDNRFKQISYKKGQPLIVKGEALHAGSINEFLSSLNCTAAIPPANIRKTARKKTLYTYELSIDY